MKISELKAKIYELEKSHPNIDDMEIGPIFYASGENVIMMVTDVVLVKDAAWENGADAIGIEWIT
jgi:hypothetical protein